MPFADSARAALQNLNADDPMRVVLEYLLNHGLGRANAHPRPDIEAHLGNSGYQDVSDPVPAGYSC